MEDTRGLVSVQGPSASERVGSSALRPESYPKPIQGGRVNGTTGKILTPFTPSLSNPVDRYQGVDPSLPTQEVPTVSVG